MPRGGRARAQQRGERASRWERSAQSLWRLRFGRAFAAQDGVGWVGPFFRLCQRVAELGAAAVQSRFDRGNREAEALSDLLEGQVGVVVQKDRQAVRGIELREGIDQGGIVLRQNGF